MLFFGCLTYNSKDTTETTKIAIAIKAKITVRSAEVELGGEIGPMFGSDSVGVGRQITASFN